MYNLRKGERWEWRYYPDDKVIVELSESFSVSNNETIITTSKREIRNCQETNNSRAVFFYKDITTKNWKKLEGQEVPSEI